MSPSLQALVKKDADWDRSGDIALRWSADFATLVDRRLAAGAGPMGLIAAAFGRFLGSFRKAPR
jgi:hypothetical protein